jgi:hypothetical protein
MKFASGSLLASAVLLVLLPNTSAFAADNRKPVRLIAEAEDFTVRAGQWAVVPYRENYFASTFAISFLSRMGCLGAPEQLPADEPAVAEQAVQIPYADQYELLVRYEQPYDFSVEFTVEVEQGGKVVASFPCGRLSDPKIWAFNGHQRKPMERYWWGGTDNIVWQHPGSLRLNAGPAVLRLVAGQQVDADKLRLNAARRNVDVVVLTNDREGMETQRAKARYLELDGWLVLEGDLFVRFTNPANGPGPCIPIVQPLSGGQHSPYYVHVRDWPTTKVLRSGRLVDATEYVNAGPRSTAVSPRLLAPVLTAAKFTQPKNPDKPEAGTHVMIPDNEYLPPGQSSGWVPLGPILDTLHHNQWAPRAMYQDGKTNEVFLRIEFAIPDGRGGLQPIKDVTVRGTPAYHSPVTFEIPGNIAPNAALAEALRERFWPPQLRTQQEAVDWLLAEVSKFPKRGPTPKRFLLYNILGFGGRSFDDPAVKQLALALGDNTWANAQGKKRELVAHWRDPNPEWIHEQETSRPDGFQDLLVVSYGDEIHLPSDPVTDEEFAAWLKQRRVPYSGPVKFVSVQRGDPPAAAAAARKQPLWYYSQICAKEKGGRRYAAGTAYYKSRGVLTGANYAPHSNYLVSELDYIRTFKLRAMSMPWSEDYVWQVPEFSVQVMGYLTSGLRAGAKYDKLPIHMYVMPHSPGNTPRDFRLSFYTAVAHGAKHVNYFCASPSAIGVTENYVATDDLGMWRQIHACSHDAGLFEDYVVDGQVRPAKVGLLLSSVDDIMTGAANSTLAMHNNERKALYYALRHSQTPVDFLSEEDVIEGRAKDYRLIYVTQQWLHSQAIDALTRWVESGGTLVAMCGGGFYNEFNQLNPQTGTLYGVKSQQIQTDPQLVSKYLREANRPFLTKQDLPLYDAIDHATWALDEGPSAAEKRIRDVPVIVWKQTLEPADSRVLGWYKDGRPAVIAKSHGKGRTYLFGFLPGQAYLKSGLLIAPPDRGATDAANGHYLPTTMDVNLRRRLVEDFLPTTFVRPVTCSVSLVETTCIDTPPPSGKRARLAIPLMNYTGRPIERLTVRIDQFSPASQVRSVEHGVLKPRFDGDVMTVELPLQIADMLLIDR